MCKYCQTSTSQHPLSLGNPTCLEPINTIIRRASGDQFPFNEEEAVNLDRVKLASVEEHIQRLQSMDMYVQIKDIESHREYSLLVEFKLDCSNPRNINETEYTGKIKDSKLLLFGSGIDVYNKYIFIFKSDIVEEAKRTARIKTHNPNIIVLNITDFREIFFTGAN